MDDEHGDRASGCPRRVGLAPERGHRGGAEGLDPPPPAERAGVRRDASRPGPALPLESHAAARMALARQCAAGRRVLDAQSDRKHAAPCGKQLAVDSRLRGLDGCSALLQLARSSPATAGGFYSCFLRRAWPFVSAAAHPFDSAQALAIGQALCVFASLLARSSVLAGSSLRWMTAASMAALMMLDFALHQNYVSLLGALLATILAIAALFSSRQAADAPASHGVFSSFSWRPPLPDVRDHPTRCLALLHMPCRISFPRLWCHRRQILRSRLQLRLESAHTTASGHWLLLIARWERFVRAHHERLSGVPTDSISFLAAHGLDRQADCGHEHSRRAVHSTVVFDEEHCACRILSVSGADGFPVDQEQCVFSLLQGVSSCGGHLAQLGLMGRQRRSKPAFPELSCSHQSARQLDDSVVGARRCKKEGRSRSENVVQTFCDIARLWVHALLQSLSWWMRLPHCPNKRPRVSLKMIILLMLVWSCSLATAASFTTKKIGQSTPLPGATNTITVTIQTDANLAATDSSVVTISGLTGAPNAANLALQALRMTRRICSRSARHKRGGY